MKSPTSLLTLALLAACGAHPEPRTTMNEPQAGDHDTPEAEHTPDTPQEAPEPVSEPVSEPEPAPEPELIVKSEAEWRAQLSPLEYKVTREAGTERAFTGRYWDTKTVGTYKCICCDTPLFRSDTKFDSGCGWPSFFEPLEGANLIELRDLTLGMIRTEVRCSQCDAHLGHVFPDGPPPTGLRYCINSVSLMLEAEEGGEHKPTDGDG